MRALLLLAVLAVGCGDMTLTWESIYGYYGDWDYYEPPWGARRYKQVASIGGKVLVYVCPNDGGRTTVWVSESGERDSFVEQEIEIEGATNDDVMLDLEQNGRFHLYNGRLYWIGEATLYTGEWSEVCCLVSDDGVHWEILADDLPWDDTYASAVCVTESGFLAYAYFEAPTTNKVYSSADGASWTDLGAPSGVPERQYAALVAVSDGVVLIGGLDKASPYAARSDLWKTTDGGATWAELTPTIDSAATLYTKGSPVTTQLVEGLGARASLGAFRWGGYSYLVGGTTWATNKPSYCDLYRTQDGVAWTKVAMEQADGEAFRVPLGFGAYVAVCQGKLYMMQYQDSDYWEIASNSAGALTVNSAWLYRAEGLEEAPAEPSEIPWYNFACQPYGREIDRVGTAPNQTRMLAFDLNLGVVLPGYGFPVVCTTQMAGRGASPGHLPGRIFAGMSDGYLAEMFGATSYGLGTPTNRVAWTAAAGSTDTVLEIDTEAEGTLPAGWLSGLWVRIGEEVAEIADNDSSSITLAAALEAGAPAAGTRFYVAPMECGVLFGELRLRYPGAPTGLRADIRSEQAAASELGWDLFLSAGPRTTVDLSAPARTREFTESDLLKGTGRIHVGGLSRRSLLYGLRWRPTGGGVMEVGPLVVGESLHPAERGRAR